MNEYFFAGPRVFYPGNPVNERTINQRKINNV